MTIMKRLLIAMLVSLVVVICVAAGPRDRQVYFMIYHAGHERIPVKDAIVTVCWDDTCKTESTTNIGHVKFFVPLEVNELYITVVPADPQTCPFEGVYTLEGMRISHYIWLTDSPCE